MSTFYTCIYNTQCFYATQGSLNRGLLLLSLPSSNATVSRKQMNCLSVLNKNIFTVNTNAKLSIRHLSLTDC